MTRPAPATDDPVPQPLAAEQALEASRRQAQAVARVASRLVLGSAEAPGASPRALASALLQDLAEVLGCELCLAYFVETEPQAMALASSVGLDPAQQAAFARLRLGEHLCGTVAQTLRPLVLQRLDAADCAGASALRALGMRAYAGFPMLAGGALLGTLCFATTARAAFTADEVTLMQTVSNLLAAALGRDRLAAALADREERLRLALEASDTGLWTWDVGTDAVSWSAECYRIHGLAPADFDGTGAGFFRLVHAPDRERVAATVRAAIARRSLYECEFRIVRPGGEVVWVANRGRAVHDDGGGRPPRVLGTITDIGKRKRAEATLRAGERELQALADNIPDILARFDRGLRHVFINVAIEAATGRPRTEFLGRTNRDLGMPERLCAQWDAALHMVFDSGEPLSLDFEHEGPQGLRWYASRLVPELGADGQVAFVLCVTRDVSDRRQAEEALKEADRQKDEFLATLAHELRNPLAPIRNGLEILRRDAALQGAAARARDMMERQLGHLVRLVDDLLDVSRISRGKVELLRERVSVQAVIDHALEASRPLVEAGGHALAVQLPEWPVWVDGDLTRLAQVLSNLLNNAAKYTPRGGRIELQAGVESGPSGEQAVVRVADNGSGIAADMLPRVFDLFAQAAGTRHRAQGGLGIGLSLARRLLELHGGSVEAESAGLGRGSTFTVRLPLAAPAAPAPVPLAAPGLGLAALPAPGPAAVPTGRRLLVVDDNADAADSLAMMLQLLGHDARVVHDGAAALQAVPAWRPELVLLDIGLPGLDGYEVARRLRADTALAELVLVALTGWGSEADKRRSAAAGFDAHLTKPVALAEVEEVLQRFPRADPDGDGPGRGVVQAG